MRCVGRGKWQVLDASNCRRFRAREQKGQEGWEMVGGIRWEVPGGLGEQQLA